MYWIGIIAIALVVVLALVWMRATPRGTKKVRGTNLMKMGQFFLAATAIVAVIAGLGAWLSH